MYVSEIEISGVRCFSGPRDVDLRLTRPDGSHAGWTVLAGRNGSGKTTLLRAIALAMAGPTVAHSLADFADWVSEGVDEGVVEAMLTVDPDWDRFTDAQPTSDTLDARLHWFREPVEDSSEYWRQPTLIGENDDAPLGPWARNPRGWFFAGYGPFRRLTGGASETQRLMLHAGPVSQLASLFHEDASLAESVSWLIDLHLRRLETRQGAAELLSFAIRLLNDGLLPDGFQIQRVDSEGLWVERNGHVISLREMSDGYRTVTALVLDLVRQMDQVYTDKRGSRIAGRHAYRPEHAEADRPRVYLPGVVLIDEIDAHLHVSWQKKIGEWLKEHFPAIQFIVTSHSPYICQSADPGGLIRLPGVGEDRSPEVVDEDLYQRVVYGSGDDALLTDLFGVDSIYSDEAEKQRRRLVVLERAVLRGEATAEEEQEYKNLRDLLTSSLVTRVDEVAARFVEPS
ncbi:AAA family ATPase [Sphaerimonospora thailandensis]|uniref:ATP-binding protein n=1 Tax=Sphaerimonospora thailandensis TaxID=795644 RepID=A0A8J3R7N5_9ACTN|nr:AAA family ATPase [Sphaerimonospora thailandensis]GIH69345.1 ATP-binding protein [Sphaerimonospora thailandensis]